MSLWDRKPGASNTDCVGRQIQLPGRVAVDKFWLKTRKSQEQKAQILALAEKFPGCGRTPAPPIGTASGWFG
jgi:hypothetical protein